MKNRIIALFFVSLGLAVSAAAALSAAPPQTTLAYTISMDDPASHVFQVVLRANGFDDEALDLKMPVWMPGYYGCLLYTSPSPRDGLLSRMPSSA